MTRDVHVAYSHGCVYDDEQYVAALKSKGLAHNNMIYS